jgi:heme exporter protein C
MRKWFVPLLVATAAIFAVAPVVIAYAPYESTMLLVQKIFYFHVPSWIAMYTSLYICGVASALYLFKGDARADRVAASAGEIAVLFGLMGLVTGPLWGRKAWGVWWVWDAHLTTALLLELIFVAYLLVRKYGGPGSEKLAAGLALFGAVDSVFVYKSADWWRAIHPQTSVVPNLMASGSKMGPVARLAFSMSAIGFILLVLVLLTVRTRLADQQAALDQLYLAEED